MAGSVEVWNGSAFAAPSALKVWNGSAFAPITSAWVWTGSAFEQVWPPAPTGPTFDAVAAGIRCLTPTTSGSWTHTAVAASDLFVAIAVSSSATMASAAVTCDGSAMTLLGSSATSTSAGIAWWHKAAVSAGAHTVAVSGFSGSNQAWSNSVSVKNVTSVGTPAFTTAAASGTISQSVTCSAGQLILWASATTLTQTIGGGTNIFKSANSEFLAINYATATTTFTTSSSTKNVSGAVILS